MLSVGLGGFLSGDKNLMQRMMRVTLGLCRIWRWVSGREGWGESLGMSRQEILQELRQAQRQRGLIVHVPPARAAPSFLLQLQQMLGILLGPTTAADLF